MTLEDRVLSALKASADESAWEQLIRLFETDREVFYTLACDIDESKRVGRVRVLANLADVVRSAIEESFEIVSSIDGPMLTTTSGIQALIPSSLLDRVSRFLREVDGKRTGELPGRDYEGERISDAEARFKLGDPLSWRAARANIDKERTAKPRVLLIDDADLAHLSTQPAYVTYELLNCARRTVLAPTSVFKGLERGKQTVQSVNDGWAYCSKPRQAFSNDGTPHSSPEGKVFVVYSDVNHYVFDWDWVNEDPHDPGYPLDYRLRFGNPHPLDFDVSLNLPKTIQPGSLDPTKACYSARGDCIFCYMTGEESYAVRVDRDLTVFHNVQTDEYAGFKIKNVRRILRSDKNIQMSGAPGLRVSVDSVLLATLRLQPDAELQVYRVLIQALYKQNNDPPQVQMPPELAEPAST